jgi:putative heme-binding domain-containing protein
MINKLRTERASFRYRSRPSIKQGAIALLALSPVLILGQSSPGAASSPTAKGTKIFAVRCAGCHGSDAQGAEQGPALAGDAALRGRSFASLRTLIRNGIPASGMPAFDLPGDELDALAALVHSLNSPAAERSVTGDRAAGEQFFLGKGNCASCHMVYGRGEAVGPDLSNVAHEMTADELRQALLNPSAHIASGYELVTVRLRDGKVVRGFARSRSNFEIVVQDLNGQFHPLEASEVSVVHEEQQSLMPPVKASP